jgi:glycosyltransferase involved in cell wall biosynthesis
VAEFVNKIDEILTINNDASALRSLLEELISNQALRLTLSTKMASVINSDYDLEIFLERMANFYEEVIGSEL